MRVVLVSPYSWDRFGGVQSHIAGLSAHLARAGHDVLIVTPGLAVEDGRELHGVPVAMVGRSVVIPANGSMAPISFGPFVAARTRDALRDFKPDVVHAHEPLIPSVSMLSLLSRERLPAVGTFHAATEASLGYLAGRRLLAPLLSRVAVRTAVSDAARALASRYFPGDYVLTPNGVDVDRFATARPLDGDGAKKVVFFGRIEQRKGLDVLIQAMARLRDLDAVLIVGGTGPEERRCRRLAHQLNVRCRFLGRVADRDVAPLYRSADVFCAPGLGGESFGIVLIEAMAAGVPVVASDLPAFRAVATGAASFVPAGRPDPLAHAVRHVLIDADAATKMRTKSSRMARSFDWPRVAAGVERVYALAVEAHGR